MTEIEFIDPPPVEDDGPLPSEVEGPRPTRGRTRAWAVPVLWLLAGGLAAAAASGQLFTVDVRQSGVVLTWSLDAWGRYGGTNEAFTDGHGARLAIVMLAGAALLVGAAATAALRRPAIATGLGIGGLAGTAAVAGSLLLDYLSIRDTYETQNRQQDTAGNLVGSIVNISVRLGPATFLVIAATACGLAALAATLLLPPRPRFADSPG